MKSQKSIKRKSYPSDLTAKQWRIIAPLIPEAKLGGRPRNADILEVINGVFYILKSGCDWRMLPHDFPQHQTVYEYFRNWKQDGTWKKIHDSLRGKVRKKAGKKAQPSAGIIDSQSVKTTKKGGFVALTLARR